MSPEAVKRAHTIALGVLLVGLLMLVFGMARGDIDSTVGTLVWSGGVAALLASYWYCSAKGLMGPGE